MYFDHGLSNFKDLIEKFNTPLSKRARVGLLLIDAFDRDIGTPIEEIGEMTRQLLRHCPAIEDLILEFLSDKTAYSRLNQYDAIWYSEYAVIKSREIRKKHGIANFSKSFQERFKKLLPEVKLRLIDVSAYGSRDWTMEVNDDLTKRYHDPGALYDALVQMFPENPVGVRNIMLGVACDFNHPHDVIVRDTFNCENDWRQWIYELYGLSNPKYNSFVRPEDAIHII